MQVNMNGNNLSIRGRAGKKNGVGKFFLIFGLCWILFGSIFGLVGYSVLKGEQSYQKFGKNTTGKLNSKFITESRDSGKKTTTKNYKLRYSFTNEKGDQVNGEDSTDHDRWESLKEGQDIGVVYIPGQSQDKNRYYYEGRNDNVAGYIFIAFSALMDGLGLCFVIPYFRKRALYNRLHQNGISAEAEITSVGPGSISINNVRQWLVRYSYKDMQGKIYEGKSEHMSQRDAEVWSRGDKARIKYDKSKPQKSIWLGENPT